MALSVNDFSIALLDVKQNTYLGIEHYSFQDGTDFAQVEPTISEIIKNNAHLNKPYKSYSLALVHPKSTLIPTALYDPALKTDYFKINHTLDANDELLAEKLKYIDSHNIYSLNKNIKQLFLKKFVGINFLHHSSSLINNTLFKYKNASNTKIIVHVQATHMEIIAVQDKNLIFYNSFDYKSQEDFIYYILFVYDQLKLNPEEQEVELIGEINKKSNLYDILFKYIRFIKFGSRIESFKYHTNLDSLPSHFFYNLFNQYTCVS